MRIVLCAEGTRGDLYPLLALGELCAGAGHEALVCGPCNFRPVVEARGLAFHSTGLDVAAWLADHAHALVRGGRALRRAQQAIQEELLEHGFARLPDAVRDADLVVAAGVQGVAASAAELHGVPYRYVSYCPALMPSQDHTPAFFPTQRPPRPVNRLLWRWAVPLILGGMRRSLNRRRAGLGLPPVREVLAHLLGETVWLAADDVLAPVPADCRLSVERLGALQDPPEAALPPKLEDFLEAGPKPVYLGFGSMPDPDPAGTTRLLIEAVERAGCRALLSEGWAGLGGEALPAQVFPLAAVPHTRLFPRVAAVVHHGGAGTTTTAARAGVPQIVVPHVMDQFYWSQRVERLGLGPPVLPRRRLRAETLADALHETLDNEVLQERAAELGARLRSGDPLRPGGRARLLARVLAAAQAREAGAQRAEGERRQAPA